MYFFTRAFQCGTDDSCFSIFLSFFRFYFICIFECYAKSTGLLTFTGLLGFGGKKPIPGLPQRELHHRPDTARQRGYVHELDTRGVGHRSIPFNQAVAAVLVCAPQGVAALAISSIKMTS